MEGKEYTSFFFYSSGSSKVCLIKLKLQPRGLFVFVSCTLEKKQQSLNKETNPHRSPVHANSVQTVEKKCKYECRNCGFDLW